MDARDEINLRVLQQTDSTIQKVLKQSPYVVLYRYSITDASWAKLPYEGSLFVYAKSSGKCGYRILNRLSLDSFARQLDACEDVMETEGYVIHRSGDDIWGIWIWDSADRNHIFTAMRDAAQLSEKTHINGAAEPSRREDSLHAKKENWTPSSILA